jgi:hypothetical protein
LCGQAAPAETVALAEERASVAGFKYTMFETWAGFTRPDCLAAAFEITLQRWREAFDINKK